MRSGGNRMKLDNRIVDRKYIYDCFNADKAEEFIGENCYMTNDIELFKNLDRINVYKLDRIEDGFYNEGEDEYFDFCLPVRWSKPKEKNYRPYTLNEFLDKYTVCANIRIRQRDRTYQYFGKLIGYGFPTDPNTGKQNGDNDAIVCIGGYSFKLTELFTDYEQYDNMKDIWVPCGVEVEE